MRETIENKRRKRVPSEGELKELEGMRDEISNSYKSNPLAARKMCFHYQKLSQTLNRTEHIVDSFYYLGMCNYFLGNNKDAIKYYNCALNKNTNNDMEVIYKTNISMGVSLRQIGEYSNSLKCYMKALDCDIKSTDHVIYNNISVIYYHLNDLNLSIFFFNKAYQLYKEIGDFKISAEILNNIGKILLIQKKYNEAESNIKQAKTLAIRKDLKNQVVVSEHYLGQVYFEKLQFRKSLNRLSIAYNLCSSTQSKNQIYGITLLLAQNYEKLRRYDEANTYYLKSIWHSNETSKNEQIICLNKYHNFLASQKKFKKALYYFKLVRHKKKEQFLHDKKNNLEKIRFEFENNETEINISKVEFLSKINENLKRKTSEQQVNNDRLEVIVKDIIEGRLLRSQINPALVRNAVNSIIKQLQSCQNTKADKYLFLFSYLTRSIFNCSAKETISLYEEFEILKLFLEMEIMRLDNFFDYAFDFSPNFSLKKVNLPPLILLPIFEHLIKTGLFIKKKVNGCKIYFNVEVVFYSRYNFDIKIEIYSNDSKLNISSTYIYSMKRRKFFLVFKKNISEYNRTSMYYPSLTISKTNSNKCTLILHFSQQ